MPANEPPWIRIFISYSRADRAAVEAVARQVEALGISPYLAEHDLAPGTHLPSKIQRAIEESDALLVLHTSHSERAPYVQQEVGVALGRNKWIIPLVDTTILSADRALLEGTEVIPFDREAPHIALTKLSEVLHGFSEKRLEAWHREQQQRVLLALALVAALLILSLNLTD